MTWLIAPQNDYRSATPGDPSEIRVAVVIPVYNRIRLLEKTLAGLVSQTLQTQVIVANDGSDEDVFSATKPFADQLDLTVVSQKHNAYGAGRARNLGAANTTADVLIFIDADCIPHAELVANHARWHVTYENLVIVGNRVHIDTDQISAEAIASGEVNLTSLTPSGKRPIDFRDTLGRRTSKMTHGTEAFRFLVSSNFSVRRTMFENVGGFDPEFRRWGGEDTELGWRLTEAGCFVIPDNTATIYHQTDLDGAPGWREEQRDLNRGLLVSKIPHRFYRRFDSLVGIAQTPKHSVVLSPAPEVDLDQVVSDLLTQTTGDLEILIDSDSSGNDPFAGLISHDPRVRFVPGGFTNAADQARGELITRLHGASVADRRLLARVAQMFDTKPTMGSATVGLRVVTARQWVNYTREDDVDSLRSAWKETLPIAFTVRRRDWSRARHGTDEVWSTIRSWNTTSHLSSPLVSLPSGTQSQRPKGFRATLEDNRLFLKDLRKAGPKRAPMVVGRFAKAKLTKRTYGGGSEAGEPLPRHQAEAPVSARYIGWTGHDNLGDEALLEAIELAMPWADLNVWGEPKNLLVLGGGTLIGRKTFLNWLAERNSPRLERAAFGTGVAVPEFGGSESDSKRWVDYLESCAFVGLRGPDSLKRLRDWGFDGDATVIGDPALLFKRPDAIESHAGTVMVAPVWARDELWGRSDEAVFSHLTDWVKRWLKEGRRVSLLSCHPDDDRPILQIVQQVGLEGVEYVPGYTNRTAALSAIASAEVVYGERLHACVLAAAVGTPFVALEYRPKLRDFASSIGSEHLVMRTDELDWDLAKELEKRSLSGAVRVTLAKAVDGRRRDIEFGAEKIKKAVLG